VCKKDAPAASVVAAIHCVTTQRSPPTTALKKKDLRDADAYVQRLRAARVMILKKDAEHDRVRTDSSSR